MRKLLYGRDYTCRKGNPLLSADPRVTADICTEKFVLFLLAMVYGSLNVSMRLVFARPDSPTASVSSTIQGWFAVLCFLPLLGWRAHHQHKSPLALDGQKRTIAQHSNNNSKVPKFPHMGRFALDLALLNIGTQALMNTSLVWIEVSRASFLAQTSVVWTPFLSVWKVPGNKFFVLNRRQKRIRSKSVFETMGRSFRSERTIVQA